ncbi:unnamed protein product [Ixodes hexagonus]
MSDSERRDGSDERGDSPSSSSSSAATQTEEKGVRQKLRTMTFGRRRKVPKEAASPKPRTRGAWGLRLGGRKAPSAEPVGCTSCVCTGYRRTEEAAPEENPPLDDWDERARQERAREIACGVEPPPGFGGPVTPPVPVRPEAPERPEVPERPEAPDRPEAPELSLWQPCPQPWEPPVHTQVDYMHCLVPDLQGITACGFYWGKMDRYEAERLLEGRPEGSFLLRDSAQEEYLFSVSFRRYGRSLHARVEQWNHRFSFDSHDPGVFSSRTVCGLVEHYKDPACCMYFEPMLTRPLHRTFAFSLQHLARAAICARIAYDGASRLPLPRSLRAYLREYHYKQRVRVRQMDDLGGYALLADRP